MVSVKNDKASADLAIDIAIRYFDKNTELGKELNAVRSLTESKFSNDILRAMSIKEFKENIKSINLRQSYIEKSNLIKEINHTLSNSLYDKDVDNYRLFASIYGLIESMEKSNYDSIAHYENLIYENLNSKSEKKKEIENLNEEEMKMVQSDEFIKTLAENILNETENLTKYQSDVIDNWSAYDMGNLDESTYRKFLSKKIEKIYEFIDTAYNNSVSTSPELSDKILNIKNSYTNESISELSVDAATEHILEGLNLEKIL
jgi:hypothetical protein